MKQKENKPALSALSKKTLLMITLVYLLTEVVVFHISAEGTRYDLYSL